jgi:hypothetical protein
LFCCAPFGRLILISDHYSYFFFFFLHLHSTATLNSYRYATSFCSRGEELNLFSISTVILINLHRVILLFYPQYYSLRSQVLISLPLFLTIVLLAALAGSNFSTIVFAQPPLPTRLRVLSSTLHHPRLLGFGCCFGSSRSPFRFHSSVCSFVASLINQATLHTRKKCPPCSSAFRFKKVLASLYKLGFAFGLASTVTARSVGTPYPALPLFFFAIGFLLRRSRLLCSPETPIRCSFQSHSFLSGAHRRLLLGSPAIPLGAALRSASFACFLRSRTKSTETTLVLIRHTSRLAPTPFGRASKPRSLHTAEVGNAPSYRRVLFAFPAFRELAGSRNW